MASQRSLPQGKTGSFLTPAGQELADEAALHALSYPEFYIMSSIWNRAAETHTQIQKQMREITDLVIQPLS